MLSLLPYKMTSKSARDLARALGINRIQPGVSVRAGTTVLNWGNSNPGFKAAHMLNKPEAVKIASNKLSSFQVLKSNGVPVPDFTTEYGVAKSWQDQGYRVVLRHKVSSHSGNGIEIAYPEDDLDYAPLYTKYTKKDKEYRVHVVDGRVIDFCEKRKRSGDSNVDALIRTHEKGWVFCRENVELTERMKEVCVRAVKVLGLDFGAVDFITRDDKMWVLEVNTAPGICESSLRAYAKAFRRYL